MNERLRELMISAGYASPELAGRAQRLAELIVQECCAQLEAMGNEWQEFADRPRAGLAHNTSAALFAAHRLREDAVEEIKQHFGVD